MGKRKEFIDKDISVRLYINQLYYIRGLNKYHISNITGVSIFEINIITEKIAGTITMPSKV